MNAAAQRVKVLQVVGALDIGGAERVVSQLATSLDPHRFETAVHCIRGLGRIGVALEERGVRISGPRPDTRPRLPARFLELRSVIQCVRPDVVHTHDLIGLSEIGVLRSAGMSPPWLHTFHFGNYPYSSTRDMLIEGLLCRRACQLVAVGSAQRKQICHYHRLSSSRVAIIRNGVGSNPFVGDLQRRDAKRAEIGVSGNELLVGVVAVLSRQKGLSHLIAAAEAIREAAPSACFVIAGGGPLETELRHQATAAGLGSKFKFLGWRSDVQELLCAFDVFVMPSLWEAMPIALLEAMAAQCPIVTTDVADNAEIVDGGGCGLVVPPGDAAALGEAVINLLSDPLRREQIAANALRKFSQRYGVARMIESYESLYERHGRTRCES